MLLLPNYSLCNECIGLANELIEEGNEEHISTLTWLMRLGIKPKDDVAIKIFGFIFFDLSNVTHIHQKDFAPF